MNKAYRHMDCIHLNLHEAMQLTSRKRVREALNVLAENKVPLVLVSDGERGLHALLGERSIRMPAFSVQAVDQTGAGDALCAGLIDSVSRRGLSLEGLGEADTSVILGVLMEAQAAGAACVTGIGATTNVRRSITEALIREQGDGVLEASEVAG